jgi:putative endonuclease
MLFFVIPGRGRSLRTRNPYSAAPMYYVYITASRKHGTLYLGVTNNLVRRISEHRTKAIPGFTSQYSVVRLVWYEVYDDPANAITREKELKKWRRDWKISLIEEENLDWLDLYASIAR